MEKIIHQSLAYPPRYTYYSDYLEYFYYCKLLIRICSFIPKSLIDLHFSSFIRYNLIHNPWYWNFRRKVSMMMKMILRFNIIIIKWSIIIRVIIIFGSITIGISNLTYFGWYLHFPITSNWIKLFSNWLKS